MSVQEHGFIMDGVRTIFGLLDRLVYGLIKWILFGIFDLANLTTNSDVFSGIYSRIYVILGIFMAFKLSFSFFQYIIDPESMTGKSDKSISKLFIRVMIMLSALILLPNLLFGQNGNEGLLTRAQNAFLPSLPKFIFGVNDLGGLTVGGSTDSEKFTNSIEQSANDIMITTLSGFFAPSEDIDEVCGDGTYDNSPPIESLEDFANNLLITCNRKGDLVVGTNYIHTGTKYYKYSYMWFISTVVGVLVAALLLGITIDIAKRIFKLMVLEVIAPIPIMSLIDPKGSKDGAFSKWWHSLLSTFLDIFIKLGLVYIVIVMIHLIVQAVNGGSLFSNFPQDSGFRGVYLTILLILGLIFFAKEAPKFIKNALGIKSEGGGLFDDVKSIGKAAGLVGGAAVGAAGVIGSTVGNIKAQHEGNQEYFKGQHVRNAARDLAAGISGLAGGTAAAVGGLTGKDAGLKSVLKKQQERNANSFDFRRHGGTFFGRLGADASKAFTGETSADRMERSIASKELKGSTGEALHSYLEDRAVKKGSGYTVSAKRSDGSTISTTYDSFAKAWLQAKQTGNTQFTVAGQDFDTYGAEAAKIEGDLKAAAADEWAMRYLDPNSKLDRDSTFDDLYAAYKDAGGGMNLQNAAPAGKTNTAELKGEFKTNARQAKNDKNSTRYGRYKANARKAKK